MKICVEMLWLPHNLVGQGDWATVNVEPWSIIHLINSLEHLSKEKDHWCMFGIIVLL